MVFLFGYPSFVISLRISWALEWGCVRHGGNGRQVCPDHELEGQSASGSVAHYQLSHRRPLNQAGYGPSGNAP